jgi:hypothetical protein
MSCRIETAFFQLYIRRILRTDLPYSSFLNQESRYLFCLRCERQCVPFMQRLLMADKTIQERVPTVLH